MGRNVIYTGNAVVECQGYNPLEVVSLNDSCVTYRVAGFNKLAVQVVDYRLPCLLAAKRAIAGDGASEFVEVFNAVAHVVVYESKKSIRVEIRDASKRESNVILWIVVGLPGEMPIYRYIYYHLEQIDRRGYLYAMLSVYKTGKAKLSNAR